jgi:hypothetical protein
MQQLKWVTIGYHEELDTDNSVIYWESIEEAPYRNGYIVKNTRDDLNGHINVSICFSLGAN